MADLPHMTLDPHDGSVYYIYKLMEKFEKMETQFSLIAVSPEEFHKFHKEMKEQEERQDADYQCEFTLIGNMMPDELIKFAESVLQKEMFRRL